MMGLLLQSFTHLMIDLQYMVLNQFGQFYNCCFRACFNLCNIEYRHEYITLQCSYNSSYPLALIIEQVNDEKLDQVEQSHT